MAAGIHIKCNVSNPDSIAPRPGTQLIVKISQDLGPTTGLPLPIPFLANPFGVLTSNYDGFAAFNVIVDTLEDNILLFEITPELSSESDPNMSPFLGDWNDDFDAVFPPGATFTVVEDQQVSVTLIGQLMPHRFPPS